MILNHSGAAIEGGFITGKQLKMINNLKEMILQRNRPIIIGIVDSFGIP